MPLLRQAPRRHGADIPEAENADLHESPQARNVVLKTQDLSLAPPTNFRSGPHSVFRNTDDTMPTHRASDSGVAALSKARLPFSVTAWTSTQSPLTWISIETPLGVDWVEVQAVTEKGSRALLS